MKPYIVSSITTPTGDLIEQGRPVVVRQTVSEETSAIMRSMLEGVVEHGGGKNARIEGYSVGGKTGTAQVYIDGVVSSDTHIGSFIGFAPMDDPAICVMVIVDRADVAVDFGSVTAAPFARDILEQSLVYMGYARETDTEAMQNVIVPDVTGMSIEEAKKTLRDAGLSSVMDSIGSRVTAQLPAPGADMVAGSLVMLYVDGAVHEGNFVSVPDVTGLSVAEANRLIRSHGLKMIVSGSGIAVSQSPIAGEEVLPTTIVEVTFEPP